RDSAGAPLGGLLTVPAPARPDGPGPCFHFIPGGSRVRSRHHGRLRAVEAPAPPALAASGPGDPARAGRDPGARRSRVPDGATAGDVVPGVRSRPAVRPARPVGGTGQLPLEIGRKRTRLNS